ncbi:MAG: O-antigen polymerase [Bacteroidales bacterium]|nr:oligosaccharide repeat unit polymerase [Bacteroidales bacterium]
MTNTIIFLFLLIFIEYYSLKRYRNVLCPAVLHNILWIFAVAGILFIPGAKDLHLRTVLFVFVGSLLFQIGFRTIPQQKKQEIVYFPEIVLYPKAIKVTVFLLFVPFIYVIKLYIDGNYFVNATLYGALLNASDDLHLPMAMSYINKMIQTFSLAITLIYWVANIQTNLSGQARARNLDDGVRKYVILLFIMACLCVLASPTRNGMLTFFLPLVVIYLYTHNMSRKQIIRILFIAACLFLLFFYFVSRGKYAYAYEQGNSIKEVFLREFVNYLSGGVYSLDKVIDAHSFTRHGSNTFRFVLAIWDSFFGTHLAPDVVNEFVDDGIINTNVFTFYDFYIRDFGILFSLFVQFIIAILHGYFFKATNNGRIGGLFFQAMFSYPLIMQFFQDQYFSLFSSWVQIFIVGSIIFGTKLYWARY